MPSPREMTTSSSLSCLHTENVFGISGPTWPGLPNPLNDVRRRILAEGEHKRIQPVVEYTGRVWLDCHL